MTDTKSKARECYATLYSLTSGQQWMHAHGKNSKGGCCAKAEWVPMIEKSAYSYAVDQWDYWVEEARKAQAKHERVLQALKTIASGWACSACSCSCHDEAIKVLEELKK